MTQLLNLYDYTRPKLAELLAGWEVSRQHAVRLWGYLYREGVLDFDAMIDLPARMRETLKNRARLGSLATSRETHSLDGQTRKYLLGLDDGRQIETVLMRPRDRVTACLSSQVGCALGCVFCASGQMGFSRNLSAGEIVAQALHVNRVLRAMDADQVRYASLRNLVLMGMGEPLLNYDAVIDALDILRDPAGLAVGVKQITLSTVGVIPGIVRLADERQPFSLAVSLHAATQKERAAIVPSARAWPLDALIDACRYYAARLERRIFFEWTLIEGKNDADEQAHALAHLVRGIPTQINLIPLNPTSGYLAGELAATSCPTVDFSTGDFPTDSARRFQAILREHGLPCSIRRRRGVDIAAGCGQLAVAEASRSRR